MADDLLVILDRCLERIRRGDTVEQCLADYPDFRLDLEPLLKTFKKASIVRRLAPTAEFKQTAYTRLMSQIKAESRQSDRKIKLKFDFNSLKHSLAFKTMVPVTLVVLLALIVWTVRPLFSPTRISAEEFTLSILSGSAEIKMTESSDWMSASDGSSLKTGCQIRTPVDSFALLTFFDNSTIKLEPQAQVLVSRSEYVDQRSTNITLEQQSGKTWSYVAMGSKDKTHFAVHTPQGDAVAEGTAFSTEVESSGKTRFAVMEGSIQVIEGNQKVRVGSDKQIELAYQVAFPAPLPVPLSENELVISTILTGIGSVCDPTGASTGHFPDGLAFNQITNSKSVLSNSQQEIKIEEPVSGEYLLAVRKTSGENVPVNIQAKRNGKVVFQHKETLRGTTEEGWIIRIKLDTTDQAAVAADILSTGPLAGNTPENVVETDLAKKRATPFIAGVTPGITPAFGTVSTPASDDKAAKPGPIVNAPTNAPDVQVQSPTPTPVGTSPVPPPDKTHNTTGPNGTKTGTPTTTAATPTVAATTPAFETRTPTPPPATPTDTTAPVVTSTSPKSNAAEVDVAGALTAIFSEDMDASSIGESAFTLSKGSSPVSASVSYDSTARTATLKPNKNLEFSTTYTAAITSQSADLAGNKLVNSYTWSFTTVSNSTDSGDAGDTVDTTAPRIIAVSPPNNAWDVSLNPVIKAVFDEDMSLTAMIDADIFSLAADGAPVDFQIVYNSTTKTAAFIPDASLQPGTTYIATVTGGVTDAAGNHLASSYSWCFTTGAPSNGVTLSIGTPAAVAEGSILDVNIDISKVNDLGAFEFDFTYDKKVIQLSGEDLAVTGGKIGSSELEYDSLTWSLVKGEEGRLRVLGVIGKQGIIGSGYIVQIHFIVTGEAGQTSKLALSKITRGAHTDEFLFDSKSSVIPAVAVSGLIAVSP